MGGRTGGKGRERENVNENDKSKGIHRKESEWKRIEIREEEMIQEGEEGEERKGWMS